MHNLKLIRKDFKAFKKALENRLVEDDLNELKNLDIKNREFIQKKEALEKEKKDISKSKDKTLFPLLDDDFSNLPPTVIITADCDSLSDDGKNYTNLVKAAGGRALWINEEGLVHGFLRARRVVECASSSFKRMINLLLMLGKKEWTMIKK